MKIITNAPIFYSSADGVYSSALGKTPAEIKEFQSWYNIRKDTKSPALIVDGKMGKNTKKAYAQYGSKYEADLFIPSKKYSTDMQRNKTIEDILKDSVTTSTQAGNTPPPPPSKQKDKSTDKPAEEAKDKTSEEKPIEKKSLMDKFKGLSMPKKVGIVAVPILIIGAVIYFKMKKK